MHSLYRYFSRFLLVFWIISDSFLKFIEQLFSKCLLIATSVNFFSDEFNSKHLMIFLFAWYFHLLLGTYWYVNCFVTENDFFFSVSILRFLFWDFWDIAKPSMKVNNYRLFKIVSKNSVFVVVRFLNPLMITWLLVAIGVLLLSARQKLILYSAWIFL